MKNIRFIDCGANIGQSINWAKKIFSNNNLKIDSFEPLPQNIKILKEKYSNEKNITIHEKAVSITDGHLEFYCQNWGARTGSSLVRGKKSTSESIAVETINLSKWIIENINEDEIPVLKIDIEGSEYEVLPHLFENKIHKVIDYWLIECHPSRKVPNYNQSVINNAKKNIKIIADWALDFTAAEDALEELI